MATAAAPPPGIGRLGPPAATWRCGILLLLLALVSACGKDSSRSPQGQPSGPDGPDAAARALETETSGPLRIRADTGIDFVHDWYQVPDIKYLCETAGPGVGLLDHDGDGDLDVYLVQGAPLPGYPGPSGPRPNRLFSNEGGWRFTDVTERAGVGDESYGMGASCPDLDGDGFPEIFVTNVGPEILYHNQRDGTFEDITAASGVGDPDWSTAVCWADFDRDGDLDLYLCNYAVQDYDDYAICRAGEIISYCHPDTLEGVPDRLFRNDGDLHFTDVSEEAGIWGVLASYKGLAAVPFDHDNDGWLDVFVANDADDNFLWINQKGLRFQEDAGFQGVAVGDKGKAQSSMGTDIGDVDGDGDFDIFSANFGLEYNAMFIRRDDGYYEDESMRTGLAEPSYMYVGFGSKLFDYDRDGDLDLMVVNGHIVDVVELMNTNEKFKQPPTFYQNDGDATFRQIGPELSSYFRGEWVGRGLVVGDLDDDADLDIIVNHCNDVCVVLENHSGVDNHWIRLRLVGTRSPRDAIGARVWVTCLGTTQVAEIRGSSAYLAWHDLRLLYGLGQRHGACEVRIRWPSGQQQSLTLDSDRDHTVTEPRDPPPADGAGESHGS